MRQRYTPREIRALMDLVRGAVLIASATGRRPEEIVEEQLTPRKPPGSAAVVQIRRKEEAA